MDLKAIAEILGPFDADESPECILMRLRVARDAAAPANAASIDRVLVPMLRVVRGMNVDMSAFTRFVPPEKYDVLLTDIHVEDLPLIAQDLGVPYLGPVTGPLASSQVSGKMHGVHSRLVVALPVRRKGVAVWVPFILDTGAPYNYLSAATLPALGLTEALPNICTVEIAGVPTVAALSHAHFDCVNLIGAQFLVKSRAVLTVDYGADTFAMAISA